MLVVFRNPKDTLVSFYHFYNNNPVLPSGQSWDSFFSNFMKGEGEDEIRSNINANRSVASLQRNAAPPL